MTCPSCGALHVYRDERGRLRNEVDNELHVCVTSGPFRGDVEWNREAA